MKFPAKRICDKRVPNSSHAEFGKKIRASIHNCDKMVVEKTSGMGRISLHEKSLAG